VKFGEETQVGQSRLERAPQRGGAGWRPDGTIELGDFRAQTRQALATIEEQLTRHGMTFADVVESTVWMRDARDFAGMNEAYAEIVTPNPPARATVRISPTSGEGVLLPIP